MKVSDIIPTIEEEMCDEGQAWARKGSTIVKKYRCTSGPRKGRIVSSPAQCGKPIDIKKRMQLRRTKAKMGPRLARKSNRTKRTNPASKLLKRLK